MQGRQSSAQNNHPLLSTLKIMVTYMNQEGHGRSQKDCLGASGVLKGSHCPDRY
jgi:hypothetical protein